FPYDEESVFRIEAYQLTENTCMVTLTRDGVTVSTQIQTGNIGGFNIYEGSTSSDDPKNRIYFNNLLIERRCPNVTIWDGTAWSNGLPSLDKRAIVTADLPITADMSMCTLHIIGEAEVTVASGINLTVANEVNIAATATLTVENNANLVQIDNVPNTGKAIIKRNSSAIQRLDYTMWSSPVTGQNLFDFSNETVPTRFYSYNTTTNHFEVIPGLGDDSTTLFVKGHGYHIRMPNNHPTTPTVWEGEFYGLPNNGTAIVPLVTNNDQDFRFNMVGNPYPSAISIERFIERNRLVITGELWFWRKTNDPLKSSYCTITNAGYAGNVDLIDSESYDPQGIINTGQGFIVKAISGAPVSLIFNNSLREANNNDNFFRMSNTETSPTHMNRFWLNIKKEGSAYGQVLVNYMTGATNEIDHGIDGRTMGDGEVSLYTIAAEQKLAIQGRQLPFINSDAVAVGFKANAAGTYSIVLDKFDGVFTGQAIYIKDNLLGTYNNIKEGAYEFITEEGTFDDRFEVVYVNQALGTNDNVIVANEVIVFKQNTDLNVNSGSAIMQSIKVFDLRGRTLYENTSVNSSETVIGNLGVKDQVVIVQVNTDKGTVSRKVIL
ncbi:MAG: T9SS type A sorting domain-containing protein, partial [Flavobacterium sp.]